jgi:hypothetical protein
MSGMEPSSGRQPSSAYREGARGRGRGRNTVRHVAWEGKIAGRRAPLGGSRVPQRPGAAPPRPAQPTTNALSAAASTQKSSLAGPTSVLSSSRMRRTSEAGDGGAENEGRQRAGNGGEVETRA